MLPDSKAIQAMNHVISNTQAGEQIIFLMSLKDRDATDPDKLIDAADDFNLGLLKTQKEWIDTISLQPGDGQEEAVVQIFQENLPLFLTEEDYRKIDSLTQPEAIKENLKQNKKILLSPASVVFKQFIAKDPVGISNLVWKKLSGLQIDSTYELYNGYLFKNQQKLLSFFLKPHYPASETGKNSVFFKALDQYKEKWERQHPDIHVVYFGGPAVAAGNASQLQTDTMVTLSVTIVLLIALTYYFYRRKRAPLLLLIPVIYGAAMGMATVYLVQGTLSIIALGAGAIILGIAIDFSIHFLSHARHSQDLKETISELSFPLTVGSFTTIAAFLSLRLAHTPVLQDLGLFAAGSLTGAALCTLIFMPHFPLGLHSGKKTATVFDQAGKWHPEKNKWLVLSIFLLTPVMIFFAGKVSFDSDLMHLNYLSPELKKSQDEISRVNALALSSVFVVAQGESEDQALERLGMVQNKISQLVKGSVVKGKSNPTDFLSSGEEQLRRINRWNAFWTNDKRTQVLSDIKSVAPSIGFNPEAFFAFEESLNRTYLPLDSAATGVLKTFFPGGFSVQDSSHFAIAALRVPQEFRSEVFSALSGEKGITVTDRQLGASQLVNVLNDDFENIAFYSSLIVFFALLIGYGRIELAVMAFLPMIVSWVWILGLMGILGLKFNIVNIIISSLIFGLGDDYAIFTMDGLIQKYKTGKNKLTSVRAAVYVSVATVIIGLGVLLLAKHPALRSIAFISVTGLICVLFVSQTLQPFLFNWFIQNRADKRFFPFTFLSFFKSVFAFTYFFTGSVILTIAGFFLTRLLPFKKEKGVYWFHRFLSAYVRSMMYIMANVKKRIQNRELADFSRPAVYIANHSSFLDILLITMQHPKIILLTNRWVWKSPVFGAVIRMASYYPVAEGAEESLEPLKKMVLRGYSIAVFPEGTRSYDGKITRFHKGAFFISEKLKLDLLPVLIHGAHYTMQKGDWSLKNGTCTVRFYPRIPYDDTDSGRTYQEKAKNAARFFRKELEKIRREKETPSYFREQLIRSYIYKGPVLEWYCRIKTRMERNYEPFHRLLPETGNFYDLGCGYGFMTYMLHWAAPGRRFTGVDYDEEKIETAQHNFLSSEAVKFEHADLTEHPLQPSDGIIISDVLHYLLPVQQKALLEKSLAALNSNGVLIIRDGVVEMQERMEGTRKTEAWSTRILKFNKTSNELHFISRSFIESFAARNNLETEVLDLSSYTANLIFVLKKTESQKD